MSQCAESSVVSSGNQAAFLMLLNMETVIATVKIELLTIHRFELLPSDKRPRLARIALLVRG